MKKAIKDIVTGFGSLLDLFGKKEESYKKNISGFETDSEKIYGDFEQVGKYLKQSIDSEIHHSQLDFQFKDQNNREPVTQ